MNYQDRKFGYCLVNWKIKNVCVANCVNDWSIFSEAFEVRGAVPTRWRLTLETEEGEEPSDELTESADTSITFGLVNLNGDEESSDELTERGGASFTFGLVNMNGAEASCIDRVEVLLYLEIGGTKVYDSPVYKSFVNLIPCYCNELVEVDYIIRKEHSDFHPDDINLKCFLLVCFKNVVETFQPCRSDSVKQLSENLLELRQIPYESDIFIEMNSRRFQSHKCILHARSEFFAKIINENPDESKITIENNIDFESLKKIMDFIYSGNLEFVLKEPSIAIFMLAEKLQLKEVLNYCRPDLLYMCFEICTDEFSFSWTVKDFFLKLDPHYETSFKSEIDDISCVLKLNPRDARNSKFLTFFAVVRGTFEPDICLEFAVKCGEEYLFLEKIQKSFTGITKVECMKIIKRSNLVNLGKSRDLVLNIKFRITDFSFWGTLGKSEGYCITSKENSYDNLCMDMKLMYVENLFRDVIIHSKTGRAKANKCMIAVRYPRLYEQLYEKNFVKLDIDDDLLEELLHYLYSGSYKHVEQPSINVLEGISRFQQNV